MDNRGQGSAWRPGATPDIAPGPEMPHIGGFVTQGILDPGSYFYRRLIVDAVRAIEAARSHPAVDRTRIAVTGRSQGGGLALAVAGLEAGLAALLCNLPFLCHYRRAITITEAEPYSEILAFCRCYRDQTERVLRTLSYFDGLNFAARARAPALFSVGLMDETCPPSTVFAAYNHYRGQKRIAVYPFNQHEGGEVYHTEEEIRHLKRLWS
jgi:cephalosporin-C deacetylase